MNTSQVFKSLVQTQQADLEQVIDAFRDVQAARADEDQKMKRKLMLMMLYQEHEGKQSKFYSKQRPTKKKL